MTNKYYVYELEDYSAPAASSGIKHYLGTKENLQSVFLNFEDISKTEVNVLKQKTIKLTDETKFVFLNAFDCRYEIEFSGLTADLFLVKFNGKYVVFAKVEVNKPRYRPEAPYDDFPDEFSYLDERFWGLPGQIDKKLFEENNFSLVNNLGYIENAFFDDSTESEIFEYFDNISVPDLQGFFEDIFGDG